MHPLESTEHRHIIFGIWALGLMLVVATAWGVAAERKNTAQQMGLGANDRVLIIHADDIGMSHSVNVATIEALKKGMVTSGSIMVPCPWFPEIAAYARAHTEVDFGLHLTLTSEWKHYRWRPVAPIDQVPGLLDEEGFLWHTSQQTAAKATAAEVETELRAQIRRAREFGINPTHLDTHMGTLYARKDYFEVYTKLGREFGIPVMVIRPSPELEARARNAAISVDRLRQAEADGFVMLDYLAPGVAVKAFPERKRAYHDMLRNLKPGVTQIIVHLGMDDAELKAITNSHAERHADFLSFTDPETQALIKELGIRLTTWRELGKLAWKKPSP